MADPLTPAALELLGLVLEQSHSAAHEALIEPLVWRDDREGFMSELRDSLLALRDQAPPQRWI